MSDAGFLCDPCGLGEDAFFLERTDCLSAKNHGDLLAVYDEGFLLQVGLKDTLGATQREADVMSVLRSFTGEVTS